MSINNFLRQNFLRYCIVVPIVSSTSFCMSEKYCNPKHDKIELRNKRSEYNLNLATIHGIFWPIAIPIITLEITVLCVAKIVINR